MALRRPWLKVALFGGSGLLLVLILVGTWFIRYGHERMPGVVIRFSPFVDQVTQAYLMEFTRRPAGVDEEFLLTMAHHFPLDRYEALVGPSSAAGLRAAMIVGLRACGSRRVPADMQAIAIIQQWIRDERWWVRDWWMLMVKPTHPDLIETLAKLLADPHPRVARTAAITLAGRYRRPLVASDKLIVSLIRAMAYESGLPSDRVPTLMPTFQDASHAPDAMRPMNVKGFSQDLMSESDVKRHVHEVRSSAFQALVKWNSERAETVFLERSLTWSFVQREAYFRSFMWADRLPVRAIRRIHHSASEEMAQFIMSLLIKRVLSPAVDPHIRPPAMIEQNLYWQVLADLVKEPRYASIWRRSMVRDRHAYRDVKLESALGKLPEEDARRLWLALDEHMRADFSLSLEAADP